jgi:hypothetical protein
MAHPHPGTGFDAAAAPPERERQFLALVPEFADGLNEPSVRAHLERRLAPTSRRVDPLPHIVVHPNFDACVRDGSTQRFDE